MSDTLKIKAQIEYDAERGVLYVHTAEEVGVLPTPIRISRLPKYFDLARHSLDVDYHRNSIAVADNA